MNKKEYTLKEFENDSCFKFLDLIIQESVFLGVYYNHNNITTEHLLYIILKFQDIKNILEKKINVNVDKIISELETYFSNKKELFYNDNLYKNLLISNNFKIHIQRIVTLLHFFSEKNFSKEKILLEILNSIIYFDESFSGKILKEYGLSEDKISSFLFNFVDNHFESYEYSIEEYPSMINFVEKQIKNKKENQSKIWKYCINMNELVKNNKIEPVVGRENEIQIIEIILNKRKKSNVILVGPPGTGKTAIIEGLVHKIVKKQCSQKLRNKIIANLDIMSLIAGTKFRGELEERIKILLNEIEKAGNIILFIDEIHHALSSQNNSGSNDIANMIKPYLSSGKISCIGSTTDEEYHKTFEKDKALMRRFQKVDIHEPSDEQTFKILSKNKIFYEKHHCVKYSDEIIRKIIHFSKKYIRDRYFPDKAFDILDQIGSRKSINEKIKKKKDYVFVDENDVFLEISKISKIPVEIIKNDNEDGSLSDRSLLYMKNNIFGQDEILQKIFDKLVVSKAGLRETNKTFSSFLFLGPTGVGKTETARIIAKILNCNFIKFDMSEFMEKHSVSKFIGSPPGYIGYESEGRLIFEIEKNPHSVLLLDEIEKAHPDILNILLQIMDDGVLTSSKGKKVYFSNVVLIMTSNVGSDLHQKNSIGFLNSNTFEENLDIILRNHFSLEFRNRLDDILLFNKITKNICYQIFDKFIDNITEQIKDKNITIKVTDKVKEYVINQGFDEKFGARNLGRCIDNLIKIPLSKKILFEKARNKDLIIDLEKDKIIIL